MSLVRSAEPRPTRVLAGIAVALAVLPILVATAGALRRGWIPIGDNALFQIRARDVGTAHHPLLGTWSSASHSLGVHVNNPGPLMFDFYALPARLHATAGVAIGAALGNVLSVVGIAAFARRRGGALAVAAAMAMSAGLVWTMGSELLFDPWQPHSLLLPFLFLLVLVWSMAAGDHAAAGWAAGVASLIIQTHLSYVVLLVLLAAVGLTGLVTTTLRRADRAAARRRLRRTAAVTVAVVAVCWAQPLVQQLAGPGDGNLGELARSIGQGDPPLGVALGTRIAGDVLALGPFWARPSFATVGVLLQRVRMPTALAAGAALAVLGVALAAVAVLARRRRDASTATAAVVALVAAAGAVVTTSLLPFGEFGIAAHQFRWLWPIGVFSTFTVLLAVLVALPRAVGVAVATGATAALAIASLPPYNVGYGPSADVAAMPAVRELVDGVGGLKGQAPVLFESRNLRFAEPYSVPVMAELQRQGIEFRVADEGLAHQFGPRRKVPAPVGPRLVQLEGDAAYETPPGGRLIARVEGLTPRQRAELEALAGAVADDVAARGLRLNAGGRAAVGLGALPRFGAQGTIARDAPPLIASGELFLAVRRDLVDIHPSWRGRYERLVDLQERRDRHTVALFLVDGR